MEPYKDSPFWDSQVGPKQLGEDELPVHQAAVLQSPGVVGGGVVRRPGVLPAFRRGPGVIAAGPGSKGGQESFS